MNEYLRYWWNGVQLRIAPPTKMQGYAGNGFPIPPRDGAIAYLWAGPCGWTETRAIDYGLNGNSRIREKKSDHTAHSLPLRNGPIEGTVIISDEHLEEKQLAAWIERGCLREVGTFKGGQFVPDEEFRSELTDKPPKKPVY